MTIHRKMSSTLALVVMLGCAVVPAWADRGGDDGRDNQGNDSQGRDNKGHDNKGHDNDSRNNGYRNNPKSYPPGYVLDNRYRHDHYYPPRGYAVPILPSGHRVIPYRGQNYYYHGGVWYRPSGSRFVVILPPVGLVVPFLPSFYTTIWYGGLPYYYAGGVYYVWRPEFSSYTVAAPPPESEVNVPSATSDQMFIYPKRGQSEQQQATDRYECHSWASNQTGFDPTKPLGGQSESQLSSKRADYQRAMKACLEARGYSVQ
jgi:hypothetical protein